MLVRESMKNYFDNIVISRRKMSWSPSGRYLAISSSSKTVKIIDYEKNKSVRTIFSKSRSIQQHNFHSTRNKYENAFSFKGKAGSVDDYTWSPDSKYLAVITSLRLLEIWDIISGIKKSELLLPEGANGIVWCNHQSQIIVGNITRGLSLIKVNASNLKLSLVPVNAAHHDSSININKISGDNIWKIYRDKINNDTKDVIYNNDWYDITTWDLYESLYSVKMSPIACSDDDIHVATTYRNEVILWNMQNMAQVLRFSHTDSINDVMFFGDSNTVITGSTDRTVKVWDIEGGNCKHILEGHTSEVVSLSGRYDKQLLATGDTSGTVIVWDSKTWRRIADFKITDYGFSGCFVFNPVFDVVATAHEDISKPQYLAFEDLIKLPEQSEEKQTYYTNAKVVLVGDTGVGKSGLSLVLSGQTFATTDSTHGRRIYGMHQEDIDSDGCLERREVILWDLAGQPGYRLIHQLHLNQVTTALVVFDSRSEIDPFAGVRHWDRALRQASRANDGTEKDVKKLLVAARVDRGGISASKNRVDDVINRHGFSGYFETSAKEGWNIDQLRAAILESINWPAMEKVSSTEFFMAIKEFIIAEKVAGRILAGVDDLLRSFTDRYDQKLDQTEIKPQFFTCIKLVESSGLIRCLNFGDLILLQPEFIDSYASSIIITAKTEPDGMGCIAEEVVKNVQFPVPSDERVSDPEQEKLLILATIEDLIRHDIAIREYADDGAQLIFPSQFTRENPEIPEPDGKTKIYYFEGPVINIYTTLAVRLSHSGIFKKKGMWKNAVTFESITGTECGLYVAEIEEGRGKLTVYFDNSTEEAIKLQFEEYIYTHLKRKALPETITLTNLYSCTECHTPISEVQLARRLERGFDWITCNVCEARITFQISTDKIYLTKYVQKMDLEADAKRDHEAAATVLQGKRELGQFDVFLCHCSEDKSEVKTIGNLLKNQSILPWLDDWELRPGLPWQRLLEAQIKNIKSAAVFVGKNGLGPWQSVELDSFLREFVSREVPVIPVLLASAEKKPDLPVFLNGMTWVDFRKQESNPLKRLVWGITGQRLIED